MPTIRTRAAKGSDLTPTEADSNFKKTVRQVTTTAATLISDNRGVVEGSSATPFTITLLAVATAAAAEPGDYSVTISNIGTGAVTVDGNSTETINGSTDTLTLAQYSSVRLEVDSAGTGWQITARTGDVGIITTGELIIPEKSDHTSTPAAGSGYLWVKDDAPNKLKFTDDAGTDFTLNNTSTPLNTKVIDIGDWNMDSTASLTVAHGLTLSKIRNIDVLIRSDADTTYYTGYIFLETITVNTTDVSMGRPVGGTLDSTGFDSTSFNRGWITIQYTD